MQYWLLKSEPDVYSWDRLVKEKTGRWDGVRNYTARNYLSAMKKGDLGLFYHSNIGKEAVGILKITGEAYPDPTDKSGKFVCVDVAPVKRFKRPVTLAEIKQHPDLQQMALLKYSRLSVQPVTVDEWEIICHLGGGE